MADFTHSRPFRNRNPGDLRTLPPPQKWSGQGGVDDAPGGPFAIFVTPTDGWRALATCLLTYQDAHHLRTVRTIIGRYAPELQNDTGGYVSLVCKQIGVGPDDQIDVHQPETMLALVSAIALAEGGHLPWDANARQSGVMLALHMGAPVSSNGALPLTVATHAPDLRSETSESAEGLGQKPQKTAGSDPDLTSEEITSADDLNAAELARVQS